MSSDSSRNCPSCNTPVAADAVLCIACGYHFTRGLHLGTVVERPQSRTIRPRTDNPYEPPRGGDDEDESAKFREEQFDLTESGARRAQAVVADARNVFLTLFLASCLCGVAWLFVLPWYAYRLRQWHVLNREFSELRNPNSFSPHGDLAGNFQDARTWLIIGIVIGCIYWTIIVIGVVQLFLGEFPAT